jgi:hypothetical protein
VARVLKAKYYPHGDFLSAQLGRRPSYAWQNIFNAKEVLEAGWFGGWGMGRRLKYGGIGGFHLPLLIFSSLFTKGWTWKPK